MNSTRLRAFILFVIALAVYTAPQTFNALVTPFFHVIPAQDVVSASLVPVSLLTRGNLYLDQYRVFIKNNYPQPYFVAEVRNHLVSRYPIAAGMLALPFMGWGLGSGWIARTVYVFDVAKFAATVIAALTVVAFFFCARELTDLSTTTWATVAFAFGTSVWSTASQGLWQHTPSILFQSLAFWFLLRGQRAGGRALAPAGFFLSLAVVARPTNLVTALIFALYVLIYYRAAVPRFILWTLPPLALFLLYNYAMNGSPFVAGYQEGLIQDFGLPQWITLQGLLVSPSRGLFLFSPFLLLAPVGLAMGWQSKRKPFYVFLALAFVAYTALMASWNSLGGWSYGARMLTDALPAICLLMIPAVEKIRGNWRGALWGITFLAAVAQSLGLFDYGLRFFADPANNEWSIQNGEAIFYAKFYVSTIRQALGL